MTALSTMGGGAKSPASARACLKQAFAAAIRAADPAHSLAAHLPEKPAGRTVIVGAGKAAASMVAAVEAAWSGALEGLVVTRYGHGLPTRAIRVVEAAHPVPDASGERTAAEILSRVQGLSADDLVLALISGGGSALLALPGAGLTLADKQAINKALLRSGATISEMNTVRKHLSAIKGGRLAAAAYPARLVTLAISDVPGDDPAVIASGPTVADPTTAADAAAILARYGIGLSPAVAEFLKTDAAETPKPDDPRLARTDFRMIATPMMALEAASEIVRAAGYQPIILGDAIEGEAREVAADHARLAIEKAATGQRLALLSGGETTVTVRGQGRGGRNAEYLLALAIALNGAPGISALAGDTDGIDGSEDNAGAIMAPDTLARAQSLGLNAAAHLANNDGYSFFAALDDLIVTGPTLTNVNDFRCILIESPSP